MSGKPSWWQRNQALREQLDLPDYEAPRFADGRYTYRIVDDLEAEYGCVLRFVGFNTEYPDDWAVEADGERLFDVGRHRDSNGNTVYELTGGEFVRRVEDALTG